MTGKNRVVKALNIETVCYRYAELMFASDTSDNPFIAGFSRSKAEVIFDVMNELGLGSELIEYYYTQKYKNDEVTE